MKREEEKIRQVDEEIKKNSEQELELEELHEL